MPHEENAKLTVIPGGKDAHVQKVVSEAEEIESIEELIVFIEDKLPPKWAFLGTDFLTVDIYRGEGQAFVVYLFGAYPGAPLTCQCEDLKTGLMTIIKKLATIPPAKPGEVRPILGIAPLQALEECLSRFHPSGDED